VYPSGVDTPPPENRGASGRFVVGMSGNPKGRPKSFNRLIREETREGAELVAFMLGVLRNAKQATAYRMAAAQWLADRGWGKAVTILEADVTVDATVEAQVLHFDGLRATIRERLGCERGPEAAEDLTQRLLG